MEFVIPLIFFIIWFLGWIFSLSNQNEQKGQQGRNPQQRQRPRQQGQKKLQSEIDAFLNEIGAKRQEDDGIEIVRPDQQEDRRRQERAEQQRRDRQRRERERRELDRQDGPRERSPQQRPAQRSQTQRRPKPAQRERTPKVSTQATTPRKEMGSGVGMQVNAYMTTQLEQYMAARRRGLSKEQAAGELRETLSEELLVEAERRLAESGFEQSSGTSARDFHPANIAKLLQNPQTVKTAIIMNEVLQRPKSLRK